eukprot:CAMPEP_0118950706 /NCGR_PEP_ID=MMETSP1169-20130426/51876_1 /TAXON_ID=36882 /ORGANISM="Pyramimonas obovata, Strain CCMP722" /LENGTH=121 /DNA_ID=CAMNT_0006897607 /DNA_START=146 /DNA_END=508 /DNA_ORIENTATION=-
MSMECSSPRVFDLWAQGHAVSPAKREAQPTSQNPLICQSLDRNSLLYPDLPPNFHYSDDPEEPSVSSSAPALLLPTAKPKRGQPKSDFVPFVPSTKGRSFNPPKSPSKRLPTPASPSKSQP